MYTHTQLVCVYAMVAFKRREEFEFIQEPLYSCISSKGYEKNRKRYRKIQFKNVLHLNSTLAPRLRLGEAREWRTNTSCRYIAFFCERPKTWLELIRYRVFTPSERWTMGSCERNVRKVFAQYEQSSPYTPQFNHGAKRDMAYSYS